MGDNYVIPNTGSDFKDTFRYIGDYFKRRGFWGFLKDLWADLFLNRTVGNWIYLVILAGIPVLMQILQAVRDKQEFGVLSFITALTGVVCVIYVREGRLSNYFIGFIHTFIYFVLALDPSNFFLEEALTSLFWVVMNVVGPFLWINGNRKAAIAKQEGVELPSKEKKSEGFVSKKLGWKGWLGWIAFAVVYTFGVGLIFDKLHSNKAYIDASTGSFNIAGQFLMNSQYAEQWVFWILVNILSMVLWAGNDPLIVAMYIAQLVNSIVGLVEWELEAHNMKFADLFRRS